MVIWIKVDCRSAITDEDSLNINKLSVFCGTTEGASMAESEPITLRQAAQFLNEYIDTHYIPAIRIIMGSGSGDEDSLLISEQKFRNAAHILDVERGTNFLQDVLAMKDEFYAEGDTGTFKYTEYGYFIRGELDRVDLTETEFDQKLREYQPVLWDLLDRTRREYEIIKANLPRKSDILEAVKDMDSIGAGLDDDPAEVAEEAAPAQTWDNINAQTGGHWTPQDSITCAPNAKGEKYSYRGVVTHTAPSLPIAWSVAAHLAGASADIRNSGVAITCETAKGRTPTVLLTEDTFAAIADKKPDAFGDVAGDLDAHFVLASAAGAEASGGAAPGGRVGPAPGAQPPIH